MKVILNDSQTYYSHILQTITTMLKSILIGLILPSLIIFSGWIRLLFVLITPVLGNMVQFLYIILGITFGMGKYYENPTSYWVTYFSGMIFSILILSWSFKHDRKNGGNSTVSNCGSKFFAGGVIGMIIGLLL